MAGTIADYSTAAIALALATKFGPEIIKGMFRKNGNSNGNCHAEGVVLPVVQNHTALLEDIKDNTQQTRDAINNLAGVIASRR